MITTNDLEPGYYLCELPAPLDNPKPDRRVRNDWTAATTFEAGRSYTIIVRQNADLMQHLKDEGVTVYSVEIGHVGFYPHQSYHRLLFVRDDGERTLKQSHRDDDASAGLLLDNLRIVQPDVRERVKLLYRYEYVSKGDIIDALIEAGVLDHKTLSLCASVAKAKAEREAVEEELAAK